MTPKCLPSVPLIVLSLALTPECWLRGVERCGLPVCYLFGTQVISEKGGDSNSPRELQASGESRAGRHLCSILRWYEERVCWSLAGREAGRTH